MELTSAERAKLRSKAVELKPKLSLGKSGISEAFLDELLAALKSDHLVKVKLLESSRAETDRRELGQRIAEAVDAALVEVRGNTAVLWKPRKGQR